MADTNVKLHTALRVNILKGIGVIICREKT